MTQEESNDGEESEGAADARPGVLARMLRSRLSLAIALLLVAAVAGAGILYAIQSNAGVFAPRADTAALEARLAAMARRLEQISKQAGSSQAAADDSAAAERIAALEQRLDMLLKRPTSAAASNALAQRLKALEARLRSLPRASDPADLAPLIEQARGHAAAAQAANQAIGDAARDVEAALARIAGVQRQAALSLALVRVQQLLLGGGPVAPVAKLLSRLGVGDRLSPFGEANIETLGRLAQGFQDLTAQILSAGESADTGVLSQAARRVMALVSIRRVGPVEGGDAAAIVARIETHLQRADLASAVKELDGLAEAAALVVEEWRQKAEARLALAAADEQLASELSTALDSGK